MHGAQNATIYKRSCLISFEMHYCVESKFLTIISAVDACAADTTDLIVICCTHKLWYTHGISAYRSLGMIVTRLQLFTCY